MTEGAVVIYLFWPFDLGLKLLRIIQIIRGKVEGNQHNT